MKLTDDLERLSKLHRDGALTSEEFSQAKQKLLTEKTNTDFRFDPVYQKDESLGDAANRYVTFQIVSSIIGGFIFLFILFSFVLPHHSGPEIHFTPSIPVSK